jgi:hypothetical protein
VHKLRLDAREGARVEIKPPIELAVRSHQGCWIIAKFIGASLTMISLLALVAR